MQKYCPRNKKRQMKWRKWLADRYFEWVIKLLFMAGSWASSKGICLSNECCKDPGEWPLFSPASNFCSLSSSFSWMSFLSTVRSFLKWYFLSIAILLLTVFAVVLWKGRGLCSLRLTWTHYRLFINAIKVKVLYRKKSNICCMLCDFEGRTCYSVMDSSYFCRIVGSVCLVFLPDNVELTIRERLPCGRIFVIGCPVLLSVHLLLSKYDPHSRFLWELATLCTGSVTL